MTDLAVWLVAAALTGGAWASLVFVLPNVLKSRVRYELWNLRDDIVDAMILHRTIPRDPYLEGLVETIEYSIRYAHTLTLLDYLLMPTPPKEFLERRRELLGAAVKRLGPEGAKQLRSYLKRYEWILTSKVLFGSPSGWIFLPVVLVRAAVQAAKRALAKKRPPRLANAPAAVARGFIDPERVTFSEAGHDQDDERPLASFV